MPKPTINDGASSFQVKVQDHEVTTDEETPPVIKRTAPDGGWGWMVVLGSFLGHFVLEGLTRTMGIIYVAMVEKYRGTATATAMPLSLYNTLRMVLGPVVSVVADRFSCRATLIFGAVLSCVAFVLSAFATELLHVNLAYGVLGGVAGSFIFTPMYIIVGQYFDKKKGKAMSIGTLGCGLGSMAMAPLLAYLLEEYALHGTFIIMGGLILNCAVAGMLFRPLPPPKPTASNTIVLEVTKGSDEEIHMEKKEQAIVTGRQSHSTKGPAVFTACVSTLAVLKNLTFFLYCLNMMSICFCVQATLTFLPALGLEKGLSHQESALLLAVSGFTDIAGRCINGILFDLKTIRHRRRPLHSCLGIMSGCTVVALGFAPSFYTMIAVIVLWGLAEGGFHGQRTTIISEIVSVNQQSSAVGISILFQGVGNLLAPITGALFRDTFESYAICMYYFGCVVITTSGVFLLDYILKRRCTNKRRQPTRDVNSSS